MRYFVKVMKKWTNVFRRFNIVVMVTKSKLRLGQKAINYAYVLGQQATVYWPMS